MGKRWRRVVRMHDKKLARWAAWAAIVAVPLAVVSLVVAALDSGGSSGGEATKSQSASAGPKRVHFVVSPSMEVGAVWIVPHPVGDPPPPGNCTDTELQRRVRWFVRNEGVQQGL